MGQSSAPRAHVGALALIAISCLPAGAPAKVPCPAVSRQSATVARCLSGVESTRFAVGVYGPSPFASCIDAAAPLVRCTGATLSLDGALVALGAVYYLNRGPETFDRREAKWLRMGTEFAIAAFAADDRAAASDDRYTSLRFLLARIVGN